MANQNPRMKAAKAGKKRYQGAACKLGHAGERYTTSGQCVQCVTDAAKARVKLIRDTLKAAVSI